MRAFEDRLLSVLVLGVSAVLGWRLITSTVAVPELRAPAPRRTLPPNVRLAAVAEAIAIAEGYYASGQHGGRSLPFVLNNPGALKKPALGAADLPTWGDTGLIVFPTKDAGWAALHHQVCTMLSGASRIYELDDTLLHAGLKYSGGDPNWATNVATRLGLSADVTLSTLADAAQQRASAPTAPRSCREVI